MKIIGICDRSFVPGWGATFGALADAFGVSFEKRAFGDARNVEGWIVLGVDQKSDSEITRATRPCYVVLDENELTTAGTSSSITFADRPEVPAVLRNREITADDAV